MNYYVKLIAKITLILLLAAVLVSYEKPAPTEAFSGDYAYNFDGTNINYIRLFGKSSHEIIGPQWRETKTFMAWIRPIGNNSPTVSATYNGKMIFNQFPLWWGLARATMTDDDNVSGPVMDCIWAFNYTEPVLGGQQGEDRICIPYVPGEWMHVTIVHANDIFTAYKNGVVVGSESTDDTGPNIAGRPGEGDWLFGSRMRNLGGDPDLLRKFTGQIDEVAVWDVALSADDIRAWMNRGIDTTHPLHDGSGTIGVDHLKLYFTMNGSGATVTNMSAYGSQFNGTLCGITTNTDDTSCTAPTLLDWRTSGAFAGPQRALDFDGADDAVSVADDAALDLAGSVTLEAFVNPANWANGVDTPFLTKGAAQPNYFFGKADTGQLRFAYYDGSVVQEVLDSSVASFSNNTWYHLAVVADVANNVVHFYRDGVLLSSVPHTFGVLSVNAEPLLLANGTFAGQMDEVRIWSTARTANAIQETMYHTLSGQESNLVAYYRFDQSNSGTSNTLYNMTSNGLNGTLTDMDSAADWVTSTAFSTWIGSEDSDWTNAANWSRNVVPVAADRVGVMNYPLSHAPVVNALTIDAGGSVVLGSTVSLTVNNDLQNDGALTAVTGGSVTVNGTLHNNGILQQTQDVNDAVNVHFWNTGDYGGATINAQGLDLGSTTVIIKGNQDCTTVPGETVRRCLRVNPTNTSGRDADITFHFAAAELGSFACDETTYLWHWVAGAWTRLESVVSRNCGGALNSIQVQDVDQFSPFVVRNNFTPTAVTLNTLTLSTSQPTGGLVVLMLLLLLGSGGTILYRRRGTTSLTS